MSNVRPDIVHHCVLFIYEWLTAGVVESEAAIKCLQAG